MTTPTPARTPDPGDDRGAAERDGHRGRGPAADVPVPGGPGVSGVPDVLGADCRADAAGGLIFSLAGPPGPGQAGGAADPACLLLRRRGTDPAVEVLLPFAPSGDGRLIAALDGGTDLAEGRWDAFLRGSDGATLRLAPGVNDLRALVDRVPDPADGPVAVRIPYPTKHGALAVRSWLRAPHAEAGELHLAAAALTLHGRVHGTALTTRAHVELRRRAAPHTVVRAAATAEGTGFSCTLACRTLVDAAPSGIWDLWLHPAGEDGPRVRIARLLDDIADKKPVFTFPALRLAAEAAEVPGALVDVRPYYTLDNDLAVRVTTVENA